MEGCCSMDIKERMSWRWYKLKWRSRSLLRYIGERALAITICPPTRSVATEAFGWWQRESMPPASTVGSACEHVSTGRGKVREADLPISASLGAMRPLVVKLDKLLLDPPQECSSEIVKEGMGLLKDEVKRMSSYLDQLSEVEDPPPMAMCWMNEARNLSYDMEDYIDSLLSLQPAGPSIVPNKIKTSRSLHEWFSHDKTSKTQVIMAEELSEFRMYVQEAIERHQRYNLHSCRTLRHTFASLGSMLLPTPYEETADIVIDGRMNEFINSLANDRDQQLKVVSVIGSACLGKTTLAKVLYNKFGKNYNCRAFIRVSKKPDMKIVFHDMLSQLQRQHPSRDCKEVDLIDKIKEYLQDKRYLIIIDDIWAASVWDIINHAFPKGNDGSRIITTTQVEDVALACCCYQSEYVFEMKHLDDDHSRKLFFNRLFGSESDCPEQFKEVLNGIVEICDGLPLATISIASLLASQPAMTIDLLTYIRQSLISLFSVNPTSERTRQALNLSLNNLPHYLKTCLLYLIMYPEGYTFRIDDLVKQWVAEGFIDTTEGQDMVNVAERYLDQLIARRLIHPICINYNNEVLTCAVHDVVYDLIAQKSAEENFIMSIDCSRKNVLLSHKVHRLSLNFGDVRYAKAPANIRKSQVRSLRFFGSSKCMPCIKEFKLLRVLNLQISDHGRDDDPIIDLTAISELSQLRYLKVACDVYINLPNHGLECLETLDIMDAKVVPWNIRLPQLLHLSIFQETLLDGVGCTKSLLLRSAGSLNYLQELHLTPSVYHRESSMEALGFLIGGHRSLKTVVVARYSFSSVKNIVAHSASKIIISWDDLAPPPLLERFEFSPHSGIIFSRIPSWVRGLRNLCILKIAVREIYSLKILGGLRFLTALSLYVQRAPTERIIISKYGFSVLRYFKLRCMSGIALVKFEVGAMRTLRKLKLVFNAKLRMDQRQHGTACVIINHMPSLKEISVKFGGKASDVEYALRTFVSNHPSNPTISMQLVDYSSYGEENTKQKHQHDEIMEEERDEYYKQQPDKIWEEKTDEYVNTLERPGDRRISRSPESLHVFTLDELMSATNNFAGKNLLSKDRLGTSTTYKGTVDGKLMVAITKLKYHSWLPELQHERMHHPNLMRLLGYCDHDIRNSILVYEYMPRGNLKDHLLRTSYKLPLPWLTRLKIAVGAAKGLSSLHESGWHMMYYTGFTTASILLDLDYTAKLWGFGMANQYDVMVSDRMKGDVYNFGVLLMQLLAERVDDETRFSPERNLVDLLSEDKLHDFMDPRLEGKYSVRAVLHTATTARRCLQRMPEERPSMRDVVKALEPLLRDCRNDGPLEKIKLPQPFTSSSKRLAGGTVEEKGKSKQSDEEEETTWLSAAVEMH